MDKFIDWMQVNERWALEGLQEALDEQNDVLIPHMFKFLEEQEKTFSLEFVAVDPFGWIDSVFEALVRKIGA